MQTADLQTMAQHHLAALGLTAPIAHPILLLHLAEIPVNPVTVLPMRDSNPTAPKKSVADYFVVPWQCCLAYARHYTRTEREAYAFARALGELCSGSELWLPAQDDEMPPRHLRLVR